MIHVCFGLYDKTGNYSKFTGTTICSIFANTDSAVTAHIIHDNTLTADNREKFITLADHYNQRVKFYNVDKICADFIAEFDEMFPNLKNSRFSRGTIFRLLLPQIFPTDIPKIIYLDSDLIINLDVNELWQLELGDKIFAAVPEILSVSNSAWAMREKFSLCRDEIVRCEDYFNSGVLLMNLNILRAEYKSLLMGIVFVAQNPQYRDYPDQNVLNLCFSTKILKLPTKFNRFTASARMDSENVEQKIYHYAGGSFGYGVGLDADDPFNRLWLEYFAATPWFDVQMFANLHKVIIRFHDELKISMLKLSAALSRKIRAFIVLKNNFEATREIFSVRPDEEIIIVERQISLQNLAERIKLSRGKKFFFVMIPDFPFDTFAQLGFVYGEDVVNGFEFLATENGVALNTYPVIYGM